MNYPNLYIQSYYKLYIILLTYNLNTTYLIQYYRILFSTTVNLHKKWLKNDTFFSNKNVLINYQANRKSTIYLYRGKNTQLLKYIQLTTLNYNVNRNSVYICSHSLLNSLQIQIYNLWLKISFLGYTYKSIVHLLFLQTFMHTNFYSSFSHLNCKVLSPTPLSFKLNLLHNIKFL